MTIEVAEFVLTWLPWWAVLTTGYCVLLFGADALLTVWHDRQQARQRLRLEMARIDGKKDATVQRISMAFVVAQQLIRDEAAAQRGDTW